LPKIKENYFISPKQPQKDKKNQKEKSVKSGKSVDKIIFESFLIILDKKEEKCFFSKNPTTQTTHRARGIGIVQ
jgi:hypothetical protein